MKREEKTVQIEALAAIFRDHPSFYLFDYTKMTVAQATDLRRTLRKQGATLKIVKNRLALRGLSEAVPAQIRPAFRKPTAVAYTAKDPLALARAIKEFAVATKAASLKGGLVEGHYFGPERFDEIIKLSSRKDLVAKVAVLTAAPLVNWLRALQAPLSQLGVLMNILKDKKSKETPA